MITATLNEAKAKLNNLVNLAHKGMDVILMRGSHIVARIVPLSEADVEVSTQLTDAQAERFWKEMKNSKHMSFENAQEAVNYLEKRYAHKTD